MTRLVLIAFLIAHSITTLIALRDTSVWSVFPPFRDDFIYQMFSDIVTSIGIILLLCYLQLKRKNRSYVGLWVMFFGSLLLGAFAPLIYLLIEKKLFEYDRENASPDTKKVSF